MKVRQIMPEEIQPGDRIVGIGGTPLARSIRATGPVNPCLGARRTHVHIEGGCYDTRIALLVERGS